MVISFLATFGPHYLSAKTQLLAAADLPTLSATFSRLSRIPMNEEPPVDVLEPAALLSSNKPSSSTKGRGRGRGNISSGRGGRRFASNRDDRFCDFCHGHGHLEDKCWKKHGKPDWATPKDQSSSPVSKAAAIPLDATSIAPNVSLSHEDFAHLLKLAHNDDSSHLRN